MTVNEKAERAKNMLLDRTVNGRQWTELSGTTALEVAEVISELQRETEILIAANLALMDEIEDLVHENKELAEAKDKASLENYLETVRRNTE